MAERDSDGPIVVGDIVAVVRGHECLFRLCGGIPFVVQRIHVLHPMATGYACPVCGQAAVVASREFVDAPNSCHAPISYLKKFPRLRDSEALDEIMTAPVLPEVQSA